MKWIKNLKYILKNYDADKQEMQNEINSLQRELSETKRFVKNVTTVHGDISGVANHPNTIILIGRYKNNDYIEMYNIEGVNFGEFVERLRHLEKNARVGIIDRPYGMKNSYFRDNI